METMELLKEVLTGVEKTLDSDSVIGKPITNDLITVIPVSKMTVGFGSGGGELESKKAIKKSHRKRWLFYYTLLNYHKKSNQFFHFLHRSR